ncbi:MAG: hypothetical protein AMXMBFR81_05520 [Chthonomonas sp.]
MKPLHSLFPLVVVLLSLGCGGSGSDGDPFGDARRWTTRWTSVERNLTQADGGVTVGWNRFTGATTIEGEAVDGEFLGAVDYVNGSGTWSGFQKFTWADGSTLVLRLTGTARLESSGDTAFQFSGSVAGGTGRFSNARGSLTGSGTRKTALGGVVDLEINLGLYGLDGPST